MTNTGQFAIFRYNSSMASKKNNPLLPVYLISGEDELKRETVVKRLRKRISTYGDLAFNSEVRRQQGKRSLRRRIRFRLRAKYALFR